MEVEVVKLLSNIINTKVDKEELRYVFKDATIAVATDTRRLMILEDVFIGDIEGLIEVKKDNSKLKHFKPDTFIEGLPAATKDYGRYPDYKRIIVPETGNTVITLGYDSSDDCSCNELICYIAQLGFTFNVKFIQDLFISKANLRITKIVYNDKERPFMLEGTFEGFNFKYIVVPILL